MYRAILPPEVAPMQSPHNLAPDPTGKIDQSKQHWHLNQRTNGCREGLGGRCTEGTWIMFVRLVGWLGEKATKSAPAAMAMASSKLFDDAVKAWVTVLA